MVDLRRQDAGRLFLQYEGMNPPAASMSTRTAAFTQAHMVGARAPPGPSTGNTSARWQSLRRHGALRGRSFSIGSGKISHGSRGPVPDHGAPHCADCRRSDGAPCSRCKRSPSGSASIVNSTTHFGSKGKRRCRTALKALPQRCRTGSSCGGNPQCRARPAKRSSSYLIGPRAWCRALAYQCRWGQPFPAGCDFGLRCRGELT